MISAVQLSACPRPETANTASSTAGLGCCGRGSPAAASCEADCRLPPLFGRRGHRCCVLKVARQFRLPAACGAVRAQEELEVHNWWPEHPTKSFFAGKPASCVLGVRNIGSSTLNVTYALANLASPYNASMNLYNFTSQVRACCRAAGGWGPHVPHMHRFV